ncbi:protein of unknown function [endosymbiont DhMRE of Dentiscutata heterogama]|uniref:hypothetical protein n=1 Tax=endosymbiont DhMRE of Dentiscutata heterogama TaxID=1609546 RepID=UPI000629D67A|nr:hypothetical protein [endosymbiont DhMRE of Dentiscutata heterogama]CFW92989.1 protein of unknown function [endosymbiont DhMRE of Dentiscutata heterogama]
MNQLYINWKYNGQIILTTREIDYHCSIDSVKVEKKGSQILITLMPKQKEKASKTFTFQPVKGVNALEVWTANGEYHQHDINIILLNLARK